MSNESQPAGNNPAPADSPAAAPAAAPASSAAPAAQPATLLTADPAVQAAVDPAQTPTQAADPAAAPEGAKPADAKAEGAPEQYADFTAPEGAEFNAEVLEEFKALAKESNLSQEAAQKLAEVGVKAVQKAQGDFTAKIEAMQTQWVNDSRADKEFGGDKLGENVSVAKKALDAFGTPELNQMLRESGLGNHPEIIRAFYRVGQAISEDRLVPGDRKSTAPAAVKMYDKSGMNP
jgi:hypothetical protein